MPTITSERLEQIRQDKIHSILDASMPPIGCSLTASEVPGYIPGSLRFDINEFSDQHSALPHSLLTASDFEAKSRALGINSNASLVMYDKVGTYSAPRAWWNFKLMGYNDVFVLNGGFKAWLEYKGKISENYLIPQNAGSFKAELQADKLVTSSQVLAAIDDPNIRIIDVRSAGRFYGSEKEPRPGLRSGHIPNSINIPFTELLNLNVLKTPESLIQIFQHASCKKHHQLIFSCGSGVTACIGILAAHMIGFEHLSLYDGSWAEWGANPNLPINKA